MLALSGHSIKYRETWKMLDGAYKSHGARRGSVCKHKVSMLVALSDKGAQITTRKAVFGDDLRPDVGVIANIRRKAHGLIGPNIYP